MKSYILGFDRSNGKLRSFQTTADAQAQSSVWRIIVASSIESAKEQFYEIYDNKEEQ